MKKFSELKVGDKIYIQTYGISESYEIIMLENTEDCILIDTVDELIFIEKEDFEKEFCILESLFGNTEKCIATSMDRLLLECEE